MEVPEWALAAVAGCVCALVLSTLFPDVHYIIMNFLLNFTKSAHVLHLDADFEASYPMMVLPADIDRSWHMNNAKYLRHLNFSRKYLWRKLGIWQHISSMGWTMVMLSQTIRYRKELRLFDRFDIVSKILCYVDSDCSFYIESKFMKNNFIHAIHWAKYMPMSRTEKKSEPDAARKPSQILVDCNVDRFERLAVIPQEIVSWISANSLSSRRLRLNSGSSKHSK
jgi:acyl-CoA thioesterase FadM